MNFERILHSYKKSITKQPCFDKTLQIDLYEGLEEDIMDSRQEVLVESVGENTILIGTVSCIVILDKNSKIKLKAFLYSTKGVTYFDGYYYLVTKTQENLVNWVRINDTSSISDLKVSSIMMLLPTQFQRITIMNNELISTSQTEHYWHVSTDSGSELILEVERCVYPNVFFGSKYVIFHRTDSSGVEFRILNLKSLEELDLEEYVINFPSKNIVEYLFCIVLYPYLTLREPGGLLKMFDITNGEEKQFDCMGELCKTLNKNVTLTVFKLKKDDTLVIEMRQMLFFYDIWTQKLLFTSKLNLRNSILLIEGRVETRLLGIVEGECERDVTEFTVDCHAFDESLVFDTAFSTLVSLDEGFLIIGRFDGNVEVTKILELL